MSIWDSIKDAGSFKNDGFDIGGSLSDLFGDNKATKSLNALIDFGSVGASIDKKEAIKAEQMKKQREAETKRLNERYSFAKAQTEVKTIFEKYKTFTLVGGGILVGFIVYLVRK